MYQHVEPKPKTQHTGHHQRPKKIAIGKKIAIEKKKTQHTGHHQRPKNIAIGILYLLSQRRMSFQPVNVQ